MKITISYIPSEEQEADRIFRFVRSVLPAAKVRKSTTHQPRVCIYLTTRKALDHDRPDVV